MKLLILGAAGAVCTPATKDILGRDEFEKIILADMSSDKLGLLKNNAVSPGKIETVVTDLSDPEKIGELVRNSDLVANGLPYQLSMPVLDACIKYGKNGADMGTGSKAAARNNDAEKAGIAYVNGCGATPGITNILAKTCSEKLDTIDTVNIYFAAFRGFALSPALVNVIMWEFEDENDERVIYRNGKHENVGAFTGEMEVDFGSNIGLQTTYFVPHEETGILPYSLKAKNVYTRGCFPPNAMQLVKGLSVNGLLERRTAKLSGKDANLWNILCEMVPQYAKAAETSVWGYGLKAEVIGIKNNITKTFNAYTSHPSVEEWGVPYTYSNNVGLPMSVGMHLFKDGKYSGSGVKGPESFFNTQDFINELEKRDILVHHG